LPEAHDCADLVFAKPPPYVRREYERNGKGQASTSWPVLMSESQQLLIAWLVLGFCFSVSALSTSKFLLMFPVSLGTLGLGFIGHELAHRNVARKFGCWAEFKLWPMGLAMALVFALLSTGRMIFAAPGAVHVSPRNLGPGYGIGRRENGLISVSGPLTNIAVALLFLVVRNLGGVFHLIGSHGYVVNLWLAAFNLLPFGMMDGQKVFSWNKPVWTLLTISAWIGIFIVPV
jgi:Zn-dependent protease